MVTYALDPHFENFVRHQVQSGNFADASAVVQEGLRILEEKALQTTKLKHIVDEVLAEDVWYPAEEVFADLEEEIEKFQG